MYNGLGIAFDPEGLFSSIPSIVSILIGYEVTRLMNQLTSKSESMRKLIQLGIVAIALGYILDFIIPINKSLWTSSYVIVTAGFACLTLAVFVYIIDIKEIKSPITPLLVYGTNPLFIYVVSWLWVESYPLFSVGDVLFDKWLFLNLALMMPEKLASFIFACSHVVLFWWFSKLLFDRKIFIKI